MLRATYVLPTEYKGGFRRYDVIDLTQKLSAVAIAESEISNLRVGLEPSANALKTATVGMQTFGLKKRTSDVRFTPESGRKWAWRWRSAVDPKRKSTTPGRYPFELKLLRVS